MIRKIQGILGSGRVESRKGARKAQNFAKKPLAEVLEGRELMAVVLDLPTAANGYTLTLTGDSSNNFIALYDFSDLNFPGFAGNEFLITDGGAMQPIPKCPVNGVGGIQRLVINGLGGDDII